MSDLDDLTRATDALLAGDLAEAARLGRAAFRSAKDAADRARTGRARLLLGDIAHEELRYGPAQEAYALAATELAGALGPEHDEARLARASLSLVLHAKHDRPAAVEMLKSAEAGLPELPDAPLESVTARARLTIAVAHVSFGDAALARRVFDAVLPRLSEDDVRLVATALLHYATSLEHAGDVRGALATEERCLALRRSVFGDENPRIVAIEFNIARTLAALGELERGYATGMAAFERMKRLGIDRQSSMSTAWATVGLLHVLRGDVRAGTSYFETACTMEEKTFGSLHAYTGSMLLMLAQVHAGLRDFGKVGNLCRRIIPALRDVPFMEHQLVTACLLESDALLVQGRTRDATQRLSMCLTTLTKRGTCEPDDMAGLLRQLGLCELCQGQRERGIASLERARATAVEAAMDAEFVAGIDHHLGLARSGARIGLKGIS